MELMIAVAIICLLLAIATPVFISWLPNLQLKSDARDLVSNLQKARLEAIKRNKCVGMTFAAVVFPATGGTYTLFLDDGNGQGASCDANPNETISDLDPTLIPPLASVAMGQSVSLASAVIGAGSSFSFTPKGGVANSQSGIVQLRNTNGLQYNATISAAGNVNLILQ